MVTVGRWVPARGGWDNWYVSVAKFWSARSKDPSTQVGAVIARPDNTQASVGYNGFPRGIGDDPDLLADRNEKYKRVVHAEMNAILNAREPLNGYTLYLWPFMSCDRCAVHVIQAGITRVVAPDCKVERWQESINLSIELYKEAGVAVRLLDNERS